MNTQTLPMILKTSMQFIMSLPTGAFLALLLAHVGGVFLGALTASLIAGWKRYVPAIVIGVVLFSFSFINAMRDSAPIVV